MHTFICIYMHMLYAFMKKYLLINFYLKVCQPSLSFDINNFFNPSSAFFPLCSFPSRACPKDISWCSICWIFRWGSIYANESDCHPGAYGFLRGRTGLKRSELLSIKKKKKNFRFEYPVNSDVKWQDGERPRIFFSPWHYYWI